MWPRPGEAINETVDAEAALTDLYTAALRDWLPKVTAAVLPKLDAEIVGMTAAGLPPDPDAIGSQRDSWDAAADETILAGVALLWAASYHAAAHGIGHGAHLSPTEAGHIAADVLRIVSRGSHISESVLRAADRAVAADPAANAAREKFMAARRELVTAFPAEIAKKVTANIAELNEAATPTADVRMAVKKQLEPASEDMSSLTRNAGYQAAGIMNSAALSAADHTTGEDLQKTWICVHPDTVVSAAGVTHLARRRYEGALYTVRTASGAAVSLTPQHRVLTGRGWVEAQLLNEDDDLFKIVDAPHVQNSPATIGEVIDAAMDSPTAEVRTVRCGVDFDGDTGSGDVDVVTTGRELSINTEPHVSQPLGDLRLGDATHDRIVEINRISHEGPVYDLSTVSHIYLANGLITHNCTIDGKTRPTHFAADGQRVDIDAAFSVGESEMMFPGDLTAPPSEYMNCVVGSTIVEWPGQNVSHVTCRRQQGTFVKLTTANGSILTATANHPILTAAGYVSAVALRPGDHVIAAGAGYTSQVDDAPSSIEQIHRSFSQIGVKTRMVASSMDFHGDVTEGQEVKIVGAGGDLRNECGLIARSLFDDRFVSLLNVQRLRAGDSAGIPGSSLSGAAWSAIWRDATAGDVRGGRIGAALPERHSVHANSARLTSVAHMQSDFVHASDDGVAVDIETARHLKDAYAVGMQPAEVVDVEVYAGDHVVYNLTTSDHWYIGNGIVQHNCRCRVGVLTRDEAIPDEVDRHTERLYGRDSVAKNRDGRSQAEEIAKREAQGNIRARDSADGIGQVASAVQADGAASGLSSGQECVMPATLADEQQQQQETLFRTFTAAPVAVIGVPTSDGRMLAEGLELSFRDFPLPLMWTRQSSGGHSDAFTVGVVENARVDNNTVVADGYLLNTGEADEAAEQLAHGVIALALPPDATVIQTVTAAELIGTTLVSTPAFGDTSLTLNDERQSRDDAVVAGAADDFRPRVYDARMFENPCLEQPTLPTIGDDGRIYGHLACFSACHRSVQAECVMAPRSPSNYSHFHTSAPLRLDNGERLPVGRLTVGTGHASDKLRAGPAAAHYDNTGTCFALVRAGEDEHGIWFSGVAAPWASPEQIEEGLSAPLSGDWRDFGQGLELIAALAVNTPGFVARGRDDDQGRPVALIASLGPPPLTRRGDPTVSLAAIKDAVSEALADDRHRSHIAAEAETQLARAYEHTRPLTPGEQIAKLLAAASPSGVKATRRLKDYWAHGEGAIKIRWGSHGDYDRCLKHLGKYVHRPHELHGLCANLHHEALGVWPGEEKP